MLGAQTLGAARNLHDVPVRKNIVGKRAPADKLQPAHHEALIRRRPEFGYFAH